jgi:hypothetical protein
MNGKESGRKLLWPNYGIAEFAWNNERKPRKTSVSKAGVLSETRTEYQQV